MTMPFQYMGGEDEFSETQRRIADHLQKPFDQQSYSCDDLYADLKEVGYCPPLEKEQTSELFESLKGLISPPVKLIERVNPVRRSHVKRYMAIQLGAYAVSVGDIFTAYYAGNYASASPGAHPELGQKLISESLDIWSEWVDQLVK